MKKRRFSPLIGCMLCTACLVAHPDPARAQSDSTMGTPRLHPGAIELNLSGSMVTIEGSSRYDLAIRSGMFFEAPGGLGGAELEVGYSHVSSLDLLNLQVSASWQKAFWESPVYPFIALGGGIRQEWLGSFEQVRYPVGVSAGLRMLFSPQAAFRTEYRLRRAPTNPGRGFLAPNIFV